MCSVSNLDGGFRLQAKTHTDPLRPTQYRYVSPAFFFHMWVQAAVTDMDELLFLQFSPVPLVLMTPWFKWQNLCTAFS